MEVHGCHGTSRAARISGPADHAPSLRDRINLALFVLGRAQRGAIVKKRSTIPFAIPALPLERGFQFGLVQAPRFRALVLSARLGQWRKFAEHEVQEPSQPDALSLSFFA